MIFMQLTPQGHKPRVAYQGVPGAYSEGAASRVCPDHDPLPCAQFEVAFQALSQWMADRACIPIENSLGGLFLTDSGPFNLAGSALAMVMTEWGCWHNRSCAQDGNSCFILGVGSIHTVYDLLLQYNLHIIGEKSISISHCLMAKDGVSKSDVTRVLSHPQALAQCDQYLRRMQVVKEAVDDTAGAAYATPCLVWPRRTARIHPSTAFPVIIMHGSNKCWFCLIMCCIGMSRMFRCCSTCVTAGVK